MATVDQSTMRLPRVVVWLPFLLSLTACLEMEQTIELAADGSGTQAVRLVMKEATLKELERAKAATLPAASAGGPAAAFDEKLVAQELRDAGLEVKTHKVTKDPGQRSVELVAAFPDFGTLQQSPLCGSAAEWVLAAGPQPGTARLTLYPQGKAAWVEARARAEKMQGETDPVAEGFFQKRQQSLAGLDVTLRFKLPGDVLLCTNNMDQTGPREVVARVTAAQIKTPQELVRRLAPRFEVVFDARDCKLPLR